MPGDYHIELPLPNLAVLDGGTSHINGGVLDRQAFNENLEGRSEQ